MVWGTRRRKITFDYEIVENSDHSEAAAKPPKIKKNQPVKKAKSRQRKREKENVANSDLIVLNNEI